MEDDIEFKYMLKSALENKMDAAINTELITIIILYRIYRNDLEPRFMFLFLKKISYHHPP